MVIDTNVIIAHLNGQKRFEPFAEDDLKSIRISAITFAEVLTGTPTDEVAAITALLRSLTVVPVDESVAFKAAEIRRKRGCKLPDALILATAKHLRTSLLTYDKDLTKLATLVLGHKGK